MTYYDRMNLELIRESARAGDLLARAWGWGGPNAIWPLRQFADWFEENIWTTFAELWDHRQIYDETEWAVLDGEPTLLPVPPRAPSGAFPMLSAVVLRHAILFGILLSLALRRPALKPVPACTDMLCVPCLHDRHIRYLYRIRLRLRPDEEWDDWPCDVDGLDDNSEDDSSMIFQMDDV
ncbi:hypothetical protein EHS25_003199 [Saitozyma podzolica]|uniref:Uncharacterized protein n=1 Tax=Saitozyma podzolica TaxID=1890683 RepID=A0A427Y857_9TREE|nr:hypothetical protein EHS25_003199 [Saitozyma podzolica]